MTGAALREALAPRAATTGVFAVVATSGTTNLGVVDDLAGIAEVCARARALAARRRRLRRRRAGRPVGAPPVRRRSSTPTASSSTRTSGCSRPFDCCALVYRDPRAGARARTRSTPATSTRSTTPASGTRPTTPCTCPAAPAGCRSGSRWPCTAPTPTATRSSRRCGGAPRRRRDPQPPVPGAAGRARPDRARSSSGSGGRPRTTPPGRSRLLDQGYAFVTPTTHNGEPCTRFAIVNPRTTVSDLTGILATMS